jgi:Na+-transporting NADH:ubiquinone oxidoreductase subunit NqrB
VDATLVLSDPARVTAGIVVLSIVTIELGGTFLLRVVRGQVPMTGFQVAFARAGHAHAGVLVTLGLVCLLLAEATGLTGAVGWLARTGVLISAILMSAGFFLSSAGEGRTAPNRLVALLWLGAAFLAAGVVSLGVGLLTA